MSGILSYILAIILLSQQLITASTKVFTHVNSNDGLSNNTIISIDSDKDGDLWIGTSNGLNRFDGYDFEVFRNEQDNPNSPAGNFINKVLCFSEYMVAVCTADGLSIYDRKSRTFSNYLRGISIHDAQCYGDNSLFVATSKGLYLLNTDTNQLEEISGDSRLTNLSALKVVGDILYLGGYHGKVLSYSITDRKLSNKVIANAGFTIKTIEPSLYGGLWIGTEGVGLLKVDPTGNQDSPIENIVPTASMPLVRNLNYDDDRNLWIGTNRGVVIYNEATGASEIIRSNDFDERSLAHTSAYSIHIDKNHGVWVGTYFGGLNYYHPSFERFSSIIRQTDDSSLSDNIISYIHEDKDGTIWASTNRGGLNHLTKTGERLGIYNTPVNPVTGFSSKDVKDVHIEDRYIYFGAHSSYLSRLDKTTDKLTLLNGIGFDTYHIQAYGDDYLWLGTIKGLKLYDKKRNAEIDMSLDVFITSLLYDDQTKLLWCGSASGTFVSEVDSLSLKPVYIPEINNIRNVFQFFKDGNGNIWIESENGLKMWDGENLTDIDVKGDNPGKEIRGIEEDSYGRIWINSDNRICCYNPQENTSRWYSTKSVTNHAGFSNHAHCKTQDGTIYFVQGEGLIYFTPENVSPSEMKLRPRISLVEANGRSITPEEKIVLSRKENNLRIKFTINDYPSNRSNSFSYKLEGYDSEWSAPSSYRTASYSRLPRGRYVFKVRASNSDMIWSDTTSMEIRKKAPIWGSPLFILLYLLSFVAAMSSLWLNIQRRNAEKNEQEFNRIRINSMITISHELKTQLSYILAPLPELISKAENYWSVKQLRRIEANANRIMKMTDHMSDIDKANVGVLNLRIREQAAYPIIREQFVFYEELARKKKLRYSLISNVKEDLFFVDKEILENVANQLITIALIHTDQGSIDVTLTKDNDNVILETQFTGAGLKESDLNYIKELVRMHHGEIDMTAGQKTKLVISLPQSAHSYSAEELENNKWSPEPEDEADTRLEMTDSDTKSGKILIIEDNTQILEILEMKLGKYYEIYSASSQEDSMEIVQSEDIDAIITEEILPSMDGVQFCLNIKHSFRTNGIPVIVLTDKKESKELVSILHAGADDVITKPFSASLITAKTRNMIKARKSSSSADADRPEVTAVSLSQSDEAFIKKLNELIMEKISDPSLSADDIASAMNISRSNLYSKTKNLTGRSVLEIIHTNRFSYACKLLKQKKYQLAEISDMAGFNSPSYFSTSFKNHFGCSPSQYIKGND